MADEKAELNNSTWSGQGITITTEIIHCRLISTELRTTLVPENELPHLPLPGHPGV